MRTKCSHILVVGLKELSAGKTSVAQALITEMRESGIDACGFKPRAGNTIWYDYDIINEAVNQGRLYGVDSKLLRRASETDLPEEIINPIHRLWAVTPGRAGMGLYSIPPFIVDRITLCKKRFTHIIIANDSLPREYSNKDLINKLGAANKMLHVYSTAELNKIIDEYHDKAVADAHHEIERKHEAVVYESYSDIALPWKGIKHLDLVVAVEPGRIFAYDPHSYLTSVGLNADLGGEINTNKVCRLLKPVKVLKTFPSKSNEIQEQLQNKVAQLIQD